MLPAWSPSSCSALMASTSSFWRVGREILPELSGPGHSAGRQEAPPGWQLLGGVRLVSIARGGVWPEPGSARVVVPPSLPDVPLSYRPGRGTPDRSRGGTLGTVRARSRHLPSLHLLAPYYTAVAVGHSDDSVRAANVDCSSQRRLSTLVEGVS